jgi:hypothetical protein
MQREWRQMRLLEYCPRRARFAEVWLLAPAPVERPPPTPPPNVDDDESEGPGGGTEGVQLYTGNVVVHFETCILRGGLAGLPFLSVLVSGRLVLLLQGWLPQFRWPDCSWVQH